MWGNGVALPNVFFVLAGIVWSTHAVDKGGVLEIPRIQRGGLFPFDLRIGAGRHGVGRPLHHGDAALVAGGVAAALVPEPNCQVAATPSLGCR